MKKSINFLYNSVAFIFGSLLGYVYSYQAQSRAALFRNKVFSYSVAKQFEMFGKGVSVAHNVILINPKYVTIGDFSSIGERSIISAWDRYENDCFTPRIIIGKNTSIGMDCHLTAIDKITIGNGVLLGKKITITDNAHGTCTADQLDIAPIKRRLVSKGPVLIDDHVWIGDKATILSGVHIGHGSIIAANAVVTHDIPDACVAVGVPAKVIKKMQVPM